MASPTIELFEAMLADRFQHRQIAERDQAIPQIAECGNTERAAKIAARTSTIGHGHKCGNFDIALAAFEKLFQAGEQHRQSCSTSNTNDFHRPSLAKTTFIVLSKINRSSRSDTFFA